LNRRYFNGALDCKITWFGTTDVKSRSRCTLGLFHDPVKLIKIHRLLDSVRVPDFVIEYVIYHEMVHAVCPAYIDEKGINRVHSKEFKEIEKYFEYFEEAKEWLKKNRNNFFLPQRVHSYGRSQQVGKHQASKSQSRRKKGQDLYTYLKRGY